MWAVKLEHLLNVGVCSKIRVTWEYHLWIGIKFLLDPCLCQPMWECDLPSSGLIEPRPAGTSGTTSVQVHHPVLLPRSSSLGKRPHGEGFSPMLLIYQGSGHKLGSKQHCFIQINYVPEEENVEKRHLA